MRNKRQRKRPLKTTRSKFLESLGTFRPVKPFLVDLYYCKTEISCMKGTSVNININKCKKQLCNHKVRDFATVFKVPVDRRLYNAAIHWITRNSVNKC